MTWRFRTTFLFFVGAFFLICLRLFYWQVVRADELSLMGEDQYGQNVKVQPIRGEIRTSDNFPIATNKLSYLVYANPKEIENPEQVMRLLSEELKVDPATISAQLMLDKFWVPIKREVSTEEKARVERLKLKGVGFEEHTVRFYPEASTAAKLLGFVGKKDDGSSVGYFGLEGYYDRQLRGKEGRAMQIHDAFGRPILAKMDDRSTEVDGRNITLNIDRAVQFMLDREVMLGLEKYGAKSAMAAIMEPKTGKILALSAYPSFDPRNYVEYKFEDYKNPFVSDMYEPGSTFKPLVMAAALNEGLVKPDTECDECNGPVEIGGYKIKTWNDEYQENLTMAEAIKYSDNTGMVFVAKKLGLDRMLTYFKRYGIGELTQIDLQGEVAPGIRPKSQWYPIDLATASFGQGIPVTPIELLSAFSSIANNGVRMRPQVVASVETPEGEVIKIKPEVLSKPISEKSAKVMTEILVTAVDAGEAKWAKPKGYRIAGKTGTAQIPIAGHYDPTKTIASFIGFAPADDPKFVMLVVVDRPSTSIYGAETAAPIFFKVAKQLFDYYGIMPTEPVES
jgi:stage V sporulation protein D (sporulation-specific penicillin-binding protein)